MRICIVGTGYVGLVTGACFSEFGLDVTCVDADEEKTGILNGGGLPIHEPHKMREAGFRYVAMGR
jgi:UDPglucose 6-dehydrogenase